jgi:hypothetical protein
MCAFKSIFLSRNLEEEESRFGLTKEIAFFGLNARKTKHLSLYLSLTDMTFD